MDKKKYKITWRKTDDLIPYARNARVHSDEQVAQIAASISEFGWTNPILLDGDNGVIAGHGRLMAARKLGHKEVPTIDLHGLTDAQKRAYIIADNKTALNASWDFDMLTVEFEELAGMDFDLGLTGFNDGEVKEIIAIGTADFEPGTEDDQSQLDELSPKIVTCPHCKKDFDTRET
jgi:ParB-like chromosome segregation protein Spo0J